MESNTSNSERRSLLEKMMIRERTEITDLSKKLSLATDPEIMAKIRLLMKGKLSSIQKMNAIYLSLKE